MKYCVERKGYGSIVGSGAEAAQLTPPPMYCSVENLPTAGAPPSYEEATAVPVVAVSVDAPSESLDTVEELKDEEELDVVRTA